MDTYLTKVAARLFRRARIDPVYVTSAVNRVVCGQAACLGQSLCKVRVRTEGMGQRGAFRAIVFRDSVMVVVLYVFAKNAKENLSRVELRSYQKVAHELQSLDVGQVRELVDRGLLITWRDRERR